MIRRIFIAAVLALASLGAWAQSLTPAQIVAVRAAACADTQTARGYMLAGNANAMGEWLNAASTFIVWRSTVQTAEIGRTVNYQAVRAMTTANRDRIITFYTLNPLSFSPSVDIRLFWDDTFGGALDGQGQATRDALQALWRRAATNGERALASGTGTTLAPGTLTFEGLIPQVVATGIVFQDNGALWGC